jgi:hypothetical protein
MSVCHRWRLKAKDSYVGELVQLLPFAHEVPFVTQVFTMYVGELVFVRTVFKESHGVLGSFPSLATKEQKKRV